MKLTWDEVKREKVLDDHRVDFRNLEDIFADPYGVEFVDDGHSTPEEIRYAIIGITAAYGLIYLVYTEPSDVEIHFVTARRAENWMLTVYEERRSRI
jgi:uncharacterized protein